jgi:SAM-dependent methyltransferase
VSEGTRSEDYSSTYYNEAHLGGEGEYGWESEHWRGFFQMVADRVIGVVSPASVLDVGCAKGLLVQALREKGIDATGLDVSRYAVEAAHDDVRDHLRVASATDPIDGRYSLITCIEVLEHMAPAPAQQAIDRMAAATNRILFSSSPSDHREPTHINTRPTEQWVASFAERGFYRRTDVDLSFLTPWAVLLERADLTAHELAQRYESRLTAVETELVEKREALLGAYRATSAAAREAVVVEWEREVLDARHALLKNRDHVVGVEAEVGRLNAEVIRLNNDLIKANRRVSGLTDRRDALSRRVTKLRGQLRRARARNKRLSARVSHLESRLALSSSLVRRVGRRLRQGAR